jgi:hypothetical protein
MVKEAEINTLLAKKATKIREVGEASNFQELVDLQ